MTYHDYTPDAGVGVRRIIMNASEALAREICRLEHQNPDEQIAVQSGAFQTFVGEMRAAPPTQPRWKAYERLAEGIRQFLERQHG
jgi:hypothetical protein